MTNVSSNDYCWILRIDFQYLEIINEIASQNDLTKVCKTSDYSEAKHTSYLLNDILGKLLGMRLCKYQVLKSIKGG